MAVTLERMEVVEERVDRLETLFGQFMAQSGIALGRIDRSIERIDRSIERIDRSIERMEAVIVEMKAETVRDRREMNKRWGDLANKMGTLVEDIVAPSLRRMGRETFRCGEERFFAARITSTRSDDPSRRREFDVLYVGSQGVLLNETKSTPRSEDARAFVEFLNSGEFALYFPEYGTLPLTAVFSSLNLPPDLVSYLTRNRVYAVAMGGEVVQVLNLAELSSPGDDLNQPNLT